MDKEYKYCLLFLIIANKLHEAIEYFNSRHGTDKEALGPMLASEFIMEDLLCECLGELGSDLSDEEHMACCAFVKVYALKHIITEK